ncbi:hypothetical protein BCR39DRAFT_561260 [Naematelia encephala]|uniref:Uncharacterized protein n=1 Tax=Naematelia encephala TaxID=71784 RepID=A0A1Y2AR73_9TREE|nr:hypothetical protein BCR39DRAFT_561260 [Naematelia encephala]
MASNTSSAPRKATNAGTASSAASESVARMFPKLAPSTCSTPSTAREPGKHESLELWNSDSKVTAAAPVNVATFYSLPTQGGSTTTPNPSTAADSIPQATTGAQKQSPARGSTTGKPSAGTLYGPTEGQ